MGIYDEHLDRNPANYQPLTPLAHLARAALIYPERTAIVHGSLRRSYRDFYARSRRLASALSRRGIARGDTVAVMLSNTPAMLEAHHGVPMASAVLLSINTRLDADIIAFQLDHAEAKIVRETDGTALLDGDAGLGSVLTARAMEMAIGKAKGRGIGAVGVRNSNHNGEGAFYASQAIEAGMIGIATTNASPIMPAWGGTTPITGPLPITIGVPTGRHPPIIFDAALGMSSRGKILQYAEEGRPLPDGWLVDKDGRPTNDPEWVRNGGWIRVLGDFDIAITHRKLDFIKDRKLYFWQLGVFAKDALGRSASQCQLLAWAIWYLYPKTLALRTNPFKSRPAFERLKEVPEALDLDELETVALGSAIHAALEAFGDIKNPEKLLDDAGKKFEAVLKEGASLGIKEFAELIENRNDTLKSIMKEF